MRDIEIIEEQAASWVVREDRGFAAGEREAFQQWLEASTAHRVAYIRMQATWKRADRLAALRKPAPMRGAARSGGGGLVRLYAIAAVLAIFLLGAGGYYYYSRSLGDTYATGIGQQQTVNLSDGTKIQLNTDSRILAQVTDSSRTMRLEKGEAYFEVVHDARRPFVVFAGNRKITDLGTKFSVRLDGERVKVLVTEGQVRVEMANPAAPVAPAGANIADSGHAIIAQANGTLVANRAPREVANELSWRRGILVFDQETLAAAAEEFNRYNRKKVVVLGQARDLHIGGRFRANNAEIFASLIQSGLGLDVKYTDDEIIISK